MTRPLAVILAATALAVAYAVSRVRALGFDLDVTAVPVWAWAFLAGFAIRFRGSVRLGRWVQAYAHTFKAVGHGHVSLIRGKK